MSIALYSNKKSPPRTKSSGSVSHLVIVTTDFGRHLLPHAGNRTFRAPVSQRPAQRKDCAIFDPLEGTKHRAIIRHGHCPGSVAHRLMITRQSCHNSPVRTSLDGADDDIRRYQGLGQSQSSRSCRCDKVSCPRYARSVSIAPLDGSSALFGRRRSAKIRDMPGNGRI